LGNLDRADFVNLRGDEVVVERPQDAFGGTSMQRTADGRPAAVEFTANYELGGKFRCGTLHVG
jgi:hypothetical protein